jgi:O-antigen/teichoic acid export membrane protein
MFTAHQRIFELAFFGMFRTFSVFAVSWYLLSVSSDRLIFYAICMMAINTSIPVAQIVRAVWRYDACRVKVSYMYNLVYTKKLFQYVSWKMFGTSCYTMRSQGVPILVNLHFGPAINAAYNLAFSLSAQATSLSTAMTQAFQPAIVSAEGSGDRQKMLSMAMQACKFGSLLVLLFTIPLILEMETLLKLWLKTPPEYAGALCQWMLSMLVVDRITGGHMLGINARGKIAAYELIQGIMLFMALPLLWGFFHLGFNPVSIGYALFISMLAYCIGRVLFAKVLLDFSIIQWGREVLVPILLLITVASIIGLIVINIVEASLLRMALTSVITGIVTCLIGWSIVFDQSERIFALNGFKRLFIKRITPKSG